MTDTPPKARTLITDLSGPQGMILIGNELYIAEMNKISKINIEDSTPTTVDVITGLTSPIQFVLNGDDLYISEYTLRKIVSTQLTLSSNEGVYAENIRLFPNPSSAFIEVSGLSQSEEFIIYNTLGEEVSTGFISTNEKIDVGDEDKKIIEIHSYKYLITGVPFYNNENENEFKETLENILSKAND